MGITRSNFVNRYLFAKEQLEKLEKKKYEYLTDNVIEPFGKIKYMDISTCVLAHATVHDGKMNIEKSIEALGVDETELNEKAMKYLNTDISDWDADFHTRIKQIRNTEKLLKYREAINIFENSMSDNDKTTLAIAKLNKMDINFG